MIRLNLAAWIYYAQNVPKWYTYTTIAAYVHPWTRAHIGRPMLSYGVRVTWNVTSASARAILSTPLRTPSSLGAARGLTVGNMAGAVAAGYGLGAAAGTAIAYAGWGVEGAKDAIDLYTFQVSPSEYLDTVGHALDKTWNQIFA